VWQVLDVALAKLKKKMFAEQHLVALCLPATRRLDIYGEGATA
jgi:hypothetical protein